MTPDQTAHVRAHVAAVSKLLLGNKTMNPGLMILAGDPLSPLNRIEFGRTAVEAQVDLVYMEFAIGETGVPVMTGMKNATPKRLGCDGFRTPCRSRAIGLIRMGMIRSVRGVRCLNASSLIARSASSS